MIYTKGLCFGYECADVLSCTQVSTSRVILMTTTMTVRLESDIKARLDELAEATQRSKSFLAAEAIREYVEINEWQVKETQQALREADAGDFADDAELDTLADKWGR